MIRTVISLDPEDKQWLEQQAKSQQTTMAHLIRQAVRHMRQESEAQTPSFTTLLKLTQGIWTKGDSLQYQQAIRAEWH